MNIIKRETVEQAVTALLKVVENKLTNKRTSKSLFQDENEKIYIMLSVKKIPLAKLDHNKVVKLPLMHPIFTETATICLFVKNGNRFKLDDDIAKQHYKELLENKGVKCIDEIITLHQLGAEFKPFEAKRHLCNSYDLFLADSRIKEDLPELIGKEFWKKKRLPVKVNMKAADLKQEFEKILSCTYLYTHGRGSSWSVPVAYQSFNEKKVTENVVQAIDHLSTAIPGGWDNIRSIHIKTQTSLAVPIFLSTDSPNDVQLKKPKKRDHSKAEELSTRLNTKVRVQLDGSVKLVIDGNMPDGEDETSDEEVDFRDLVSRKNPIDKKIRKSKKRKNGKKRQAKSAIKSK